MMQLDRRTFLGLGTLATAGALMDGWTPLRAQDVRGLPLTKDVATTAGRVRGAVRFGVNQFWGVPVRRLHRGREQVHASLGSCRVDRNARLFPGRQSCPSRP